MFETEADLVALQAVLDRTHELGGSHLLDVVAPERRLDAAALVERLDGMKLLVLATSTSDGRPIAGPVDGFFYRGRFHFGSSPQSLRMRHISSRPAVSATHVAGEHFAVTVHGRAEYIDVNAPEHTGFRQVLLDEYVPRFGAEWEAMLDTGAAAYARIHPDRMYAFSMPHPLDP